MINSLMATGGGLASVRTLALRKAAPENENPEQQGILSLQRQGIDATSIVGNGYIKESFNGLKTC